MPSSPSPAGESLQNLLFEELEVGMRASCERVLTAPEAEWFTLLASGPARPVSPAATADDAPRVAPHDGWMLALLAGLIATRLPGPGTLWRRQALRFHAAPRIGERLRVALEVAALMPADRGVRLACRVTRADDTPILEGELEVEAPTERIRWQRTRLPELGGARAPSGVQRLLARVVSLEPIRVAVIHPCDETSLAAALEARREQLIEPVLVAPRQRLQELAAAHGLDLEGVAIEDVPHSHAAAARGAELACRGQVEALMKGSLHTDELMGAVLARDAGLRTARRVSHCYVLQTPHYPRPFIVTDAAINIDPDLAQKADIVRNAIALAHVIGVARPKVAILAAVETVSASMQATLDAAALCKMADRGQITGGVLDGPLAFDNAVSPAAAERKGIRSPVAGQADILVVPDLESGNMLAKQLIFMGDAASAGIVLGARVPVILTSRAETRATRITSCALAVLLAHHYRAAPP